MAKRFTDTNKYKKPFIRSLKAPYKILWDYILHDCDHAGLWIVDFDVAQIYIGTDAPVNYQDALKSFNSEETRIYEIKGGKYWFIPSFLEFQYGSELSKSNNIFKGIDKILTKYDLYQYLDIEITDEGTTKSSIRNRISKRVRQQIFANNDSTCQYCGEVKPFSELQVDHIVPIEHGGDNSDENLTCSCLRCNKHKSDLLPWVFLETDHSFLNPTDKLKGAISSLKGAFNPLQGGKDKDKDKDKVKDKVKDKDKVNIKSKRARASLYPKPLTFEQIQDIVTLWNTFATKMQKVHDATIFGNGLWNLAEELGYEGIIQTITNYKQARALKNTKSYEHPFGKFIHKNYMPYRPGYYDPDAYQWENQAKGKTKNEKNQRNFSGQKVDYGTSIEV